MQISPRHTYQEYRYPKKTSLQEMYLNPTGCKKYYSRKHRNGIGDNKPLLTIWCPDNTIHVQDKKSVECEAIKNGEG
jgi:hypothetical protein